MKQRFGRHKLPTLPVHPDRKALVVERCRGLRVLHVGCADAPYTAERLASGGLLHAQIRAVAKDLWGLDLDHHALALLKEAGFDHLFAADLCAGEGLAPIRGETFDLIVATEVLEHLLCPGTALQHLASVMRAGQTKLLVTVPNAYRVDTLLGLLRGVEFVHPDHNAWYSWFTAVRLMEKSGLSVVESGFYSHHRPGLMPSSLARMSRASWKHWEKGKQRLVGMATRIGVGATDPARGKDRFEPDETGGPNDSGAHGPARNSIPENGTLRWLSRLRGYLAGLPPRLVVTMLARRPAIWADGIYVVATRNGSGETSA